MRARRNGCRYDPAMIGETAASADGCGGCSSDKKPSRGQPVHWLAAGDVLAQDVGLPVRRAWTRRLRDAAALIRSVAARRPATPPARRRRRDWAGAE